MADTIKFSEDEMKKLQELQTSYQSKTIEFGQLRVQSILLKQQLDALEQQEAQMALRQIHQGRWMRGLYFLRVAVKQSCRQERQGSTPSAITAIRE